MKKKPIKLVDIDTSLANAIAVMKKNYGATAIKVELEGDLGREDHESYYSESNCQEFILDFVANKLTGKTTEQLWSDAKSVTDTYKLIPGLTYAQFYEDGSVDSEFTFTVMIDHYKDVLVYIDAFKALAEALDSKISTSGAGMHIAILNSPDGSYIGNRVDITKHRNFKQAMNHFMPALYFLAAADHSTRGLSYRMPKVSRTDKYSAINASADMYEYRIFDTCYDKPERFLDFLCVIAKTLEFYKTEPTTFSFFNKIGTINIIEDRVVQKMYWSRKHIDALDYGLQILRPDHKSIDQLKKERGYSLTKKKLAEREKRRELKWRIEYPEFKTRLKKATQSYRGKIESEYLEYKSAWERNPEYYTNPGEFNTFFASRLKQYLGFNTIDNIRGVRQYIDMKKRQTSNGGTPVTI